MGNMISTEFLKLRQRKFLLINIVSLALYLMCILNAELTVIRGSGMQNFRNLLIIPFPLIVLIHTLVLGILGISLFNHEYQARTIGQLKIISVSMLQFVIAKLSVIIVFSVLLMCGVMIESLMVGISLGYKDITLANIFHSFGFLMLIAMTLPLALMPVFFIGATCKKNTIVPISSLFLYLAITILPSMGMIKIDSDILAYIYPLGSAVLLQQEYLYRTFPAAVLDGTKATANIPFSAFCLIGFSILFIVLSANALKMQEL